ncbi:MAG: helix-turn-helix transcriptional regulator [Nocardiopsaceae bacterium]|nr:helix-turn-helix transcriptional regulator [Nocardiopsaceae bacterium]
MYLEFLEGGSMVDDVAARLLADTLLLVNHDVLLADIETSAGRPHVALEILERHRDGRFSALAEVSRGRAFLALDDLPAARRCVHGVLGGTRLSRYVLVETMLLGAMIATRDRDPARALEMVTNALDIADGDLVLPFARARKALGGLLARHPATAGRWPGPLAGPVRDAGPAAVPVPRPREVPPRLTEREQSVLTYLATSMAAAEIAGELYLSVNTVKTHQAAIYRKLGARGRREAVRRARELELL